MVFIKKINHAFRIQRDGAAKMRSAIRGPSLMTCSLRCLLSRCCSSGFIKVEVQHENEAECLFCCTRTSFDKAVLVSKSLKLHCSQAISTLFCNSTIQWCQTARQLYIGAKINGLQSSIKQQRTLMVSQQLKMVILSERYMSLPIMSKRK